MQTFYDKVMNPPPALPTQSSGGGGGGGSGTPLPSNPNGQGQGAVTSNPPSLGTNSRDPNALIGPAGFGAAGYIAPLGTWPYTIDFENDGSAAAQVVTVTQQLDPSLDWTTFQLGSFGWGPVNIIVPAGLTQYRTTVSYQNADGTALNVLVALQFNVQTGLLTASFTSLDPRTGQAPTGALDGFLYPENGTGIGDGYVQYTVQPLSTLTTGTVITQQASVVFDTNAAIATNPAVNTIDAGPPTSSVAALPAVELTPSFTVSWSGQDDAGGSGIAAYWVFVSDNGDAFTPWLTDTTATSAAYSGQPGHTYAFYSVAVDNVGNTQPIPTTAQTTTLDLTPTTLSAVSGSGTYDASATLTATLTDAGGTPLANEEVTFTLGGVPVGSVSTDPSGVATLTGVSLAGIGAGTYTGDVSAAFAQSSPDAAASASGDLVVSAATPSVSATAQSLTYGTALADGQLSGTATLTVGSQVLNVPGAFTFGALAGTVLAPGVYSETVTFVPGDGTDFNTVTIGVTVQVGQAAPTVALTPITLAPGTPLADSQLNGSATWVVGGQSVTVAGQFSFGALAGTVPPPGSTSEPVTFTPADTTDYTTVATSVTVNVPGNSPPANIGLLLLDPTGSGALTLGGSSILAVSPANQGAVMVDSASGSGVELSGRSILVAGEIAVGGNPGVSKASGTIVAGPVKTNVSAAPDPLAGLAAPSAPLAPAPRRFGNLVEYQPGTYPNGINVGGNTLAVLGPGVYDVTGGGLSVSGAAELVGAGVVLYLGAGASGGVNLGGSARATLVGPSSGPYQGISLFASAAVGSFTIDGRAALSALGALDVPGARVQLSGNAGLYALGSEVIAGDLSLSGSAIVAIDARAVSVHPAVQPAVSVRRSSSGPPVLIDAALHALNAERTVAGHEVVVFGRPVVVSTLPQRLKYVPSVVVKRSGG